MRYEVLSHLVQITITFSVASVEKNRFMLGWFTEECRFSLHLPNQCTVGLKESTHSVAASTLAIEFEL